MIDGVSIIIPTYNGGEVFLKSLEAICGQDYPGELDLIVIDSGSTDETVLVAKRAGARVSCIKNEDFHHSRTRSSALRLAKFDKIVYFVQDAIPVSKDWLSRLCAVLEQDDVAAVSVRQVPHEEADIAARFEVEFHGKYLGDEPCLKHVESSTWFNDHSYDDALHLIRHDNVCAIYKRNLLERYPFPEVDFAEDMAWSHGMLMQGYKILYDPRIMIKHSHNRPPEYRFKRAIVDSIACTKILGRVKEDISYLSVSELIDIADSLISFSKDLKRQLVTQAGLSAQFTDIVTSYVKTNESPMNKQMRKLFKKILNRSKNDCHVSRFQQVYSNHIRYVMSLIAESYTLSSVDDYACVDQITASTLGRLFGELYSGHMLKGAVPREVNDLVQPYLSGV